LLTNYDGQFAKVKKVWDIKRMGKAPFIVIHLGVLIISGLFDDIDWDE
jgi:hypothetical protein